MINKLSVIIPACNEWPQVAFTIRNIAEELDGYIDFEIIVIDNYCEKVFKQGYPPDRGHARYTHPNFKGKVWSAYETLEDGCQHNIGHLQAVAERCSWLKYVRYEEKLSHWNAKRVGIEQAATGNILWFCDAHCIITKNTLVRMFKYYVDRQEEIHGSLHLPLTYHILENRKLIYKLVYNPDAAEIHYSFTGYRDDEFPYEVPVMSTCGMMISREIYDKIGGWPKFLGIYGGGENFINFVLAVAGYKKWIFPGKPLHHHGDKRGYHYEGDDYLKNRMLATYLAAGRRWLTYMIERGKHPTALKQRIADQVLENCWEQRELIKKQLVYPNIEDWIEIWLPK